MTNNPSLLFHINEVFRIVRFRSRKFLIAKFMDQSRYTRSIIWPNAPGYFQDPGSLIYSTDFFPFFKIEAIIVSEVMKERWYLSVKLCLSDLLWKIIFWYLINTISGSLIIVSEDYFTTVLYWQITHHSCSISMRFSALSDSDPESSSWLNSLISLDTLGQ